MRIDERPVRRQSSRGDTIYRAVVALGPVSSQDRRTAMISISPSAKEWVRHRVHGSDALWILVPGARLLKRQGMPEGVIDADADNLVFRERAA